MNLEMKMENGEFLCTVLIVGRLAVGVANPPYYVSDC
jgi:hypothetical protein